MFFFNGGSHDEGAPKVVIFHQIQHDGGAPGGIFFKEGRMTGALENSTKSVENQCVFFCLLE